MSSGPHSLLKQMAGSTRQQRTARILHASMIEFRVLLVHLYIRTRAGQQKEEAHNFINLMSTKRGKKFLGSDFSIGLQQIEFASRKDWASLMHLKSKCVHTVHSWEKKARGETKLNVRIARIAALRLSAAFFVLD